MTEQLHQLTKWVNGYSKLEVQTAIEGFKDLRGIAKFTIDENPKSNTKAEVLIYRTCSLVITKLETLQINRI